MDSERGGEKREENRRGGEGVGKGTGDYSNIIIVDVLVPG